MSSLRILMERAPSDVNRYILTPKWKNCDVVCEITAHDTASRNAAWAWIMAGVWITTGLRTISSMQGESLVRGGCDPIRRWHSMMKNLSKFCDDWPGGGGA